MKILEKIGVIGKVFPTISDKLYKINGGITPLFLNLGTRWDKWSAIRPCSSTPGKEPTFPIE
jgi:hypothetical protein